MKTLLLLVITTLSLQAETISWVVQGQTKGSHTVYTENKFEPELVLKLLKTPVTKETENTLGPITLIIDLDKKTGVIVDKDGFTNQATVTMNKNCHALTILKTVPASGAMVIETWIVHLNCRDSSGRALVTSTTTKNNILGVSSSHMYGWAK